MNTASKASCSLPDICGPCNTVFGIIMQMTADVMTADVQLASPEPGCLLRAGCSAQKRKMRKREADADEAEGEAAGLDIAALEAAAAAQGAQDHGSRRGVADRAAKAAEERAAEKQRKQERFVLHMCSQWLHVSQQAEVCCKSVGYATIEKPDASVQHSSGQSLDHSGSAHAIVLSCKFARDLWICPAPAESCLTLPRYDKALEKANYASLALQNGNFGGDDEDDDEGEADLTASLARARRAAQSRQEQGDGTAADEALRRRDALGGVASALNGPSGPCLPVLQPLVQATRLILSRVQWGFQVSAGSGWCDLSDGTTNGANWTTVWFDAHIARAACWPRDHDMGLLLPLCFVGVGQVGSLSCLSSVSGLPVAAERRPICLQG